ncbi:hypothetical protein PTKIN_Ptkin03bG0162900 [Pterospermum kingtungense]
MLLRYVPLELFTLRGLSYIASGIGKPLFMDKYTAAKERVAYAKGDRAEAQAWKSKQKPFVARDQVNKGDGRLDGKIDSVNRQSKFSNVSELMAHIKNQTQVAINELKSKSLEVDKIGVAANVDKVVDKVDVATNIDESVKALVVNNCDNKVDATTMVSTYSKGKGIAVDSFSFDDGVQDDTLSSKRSSLPFTNLLKKQQPPRLSTLGVQDAVATAKATTKKEESRQKRKLWFQLRRLDSY